MSIRASHQRTTTSLAAAGHPYGGPPSSLMTSLPLGINTANMESFEFDPFLEKDWGNIGSTNGIVLGPKGFGKSTLFKVLGWRLMMISAGHGMMRCAVNDHKSESEESEYAKFGKALGCKTYDIATRSVNPFEQSLKLGDLNNLEMATLLYEHAEQERLRGDHFEALKIGAFMMMQKSAPLWSIQTLVKQSLSITSDDITQYYANMHNHMRKQVIDRIERLKLDTQQKQAYIEELEAIYQRPDNIYPDRIIHAGNSVAKTLATVHEGRYGRMIGGSDSLYEMYTQRAIIKDWRGVTDDAVSLMRSIDHRIQINSIEFGFDNLYPNVELDDEDHQSMENITYARSKALQSKILRSAKKLNMSGSHRLSDYRKGGDGSALSNYGESIIDDMAFHFIGRQPDKKEVLDELQDRLGLSNKDRRLLPVLPNRVFGFKLGEKEPIKYIQILPVPFEMDFLGSDSANDAMVDRPGMGNDHDQEVAEATGYKLLEEAR